MINLNLFVEPGEYFEATSGGTITPWTSYTKNWQDPILVKFEIGGGVTCHITDKYFEYETQHIYEDETGEYSFIVGQGFNDTILFAYKLENRGSYYYYVGTIYDIFNPVYEGTGKVHYNADTEPKPAPVIYLTPTSNDEIYYTTVDGNPISFDPTRAYFRDGQYDTSGTLSIISNEFNGEYYVLKLSGNVVSVAAMAFQGNSNLASICFPNSVVRIYDRAFDKCKQLRRVKLSTGLTEIRSKTFNECNMLELIELPENLTDIGDGVFRRCFKLTSIVLPTHVRSLYNRAQYCGCFEECRSLSTVVLNEELGEIGAYTFANCPALTNIFIPANVSYVHPYAFDSSPNLQLVVVDGNNPYLSSKDLNGNECNCIYTKIETHDSGGNAGWVVPAGTLIIGNASTVPSFFNLPITNLGDAFNCRADLTAITIPEGVETICGNTFHLTSIKTITIPSGVTYISNWTLFHCVYLEEIIVAEGNTYYSSKDPVTGEECNCIWEISTHTLISGCKNTKIPNGITFIADGAFNNHQQMTNLNIPNAGFEVSSNQVFNGCVALRHVYYDGTKAEYEEKVKTKVGWTGELVVWYPWNEFEVPCSAVHCTDGDISKSE